jgi:hypothetical protein
VFHGLTFVIKKINRDMNRIIFLIFFFGISCTGFSQDSKSERNARKDAKEALLVANYKALGASLAKKKFVLEMEYILVGSGNSKKMNQMLNYIMVDSSKCYWQSDSQDIPTDLFRKVSKVEGSIDGWKLIKDDKHKSFFLEFKMFTDNGLFYVTASIHSDKTVSGNINGTRDRFTYSGRIVTH